MPSSVLVEQPTFNHPTWTRTELAWLHPTAVNRASTGLQQHPMAKIFGTHEEPQYQSIKWSLETMGQRDPILVFDHRAIDGWHQYCACLALEKKPEIFELVCDEREALRFVLEHLLKSRPVSQAARSVGQAFRRDAA